MDSKKVLEGIYVPADMAKKGSYRLLTQWLDEDRLRLFNDCDVGKLKKIVQIIVKGKKPRQSYFGTRVFLATVNAVKTEQVYLTDRVSGETFMFYQKSLRYFIVG